MKKLVVIDMSVSKRSPAGSCVLKAVTGLANEFDITVISSQFDGPDSIEFVKVPLPSGPIILRYVLFQLLVPFFYFFWRLKGNKADIVQCTQGQYVGADVVYAHFCHKAYLSSHWSSSTVKGLRRLSRYLNHNFLAFFERAAIKSAKKIIVPSQGLVGELQHAYSSAIGKISVISNPVDIDHFSRPVGFDKSELRKEIGINDDSLVFIFIALGDFARKGLGVIFDAMTILDGKSTYTLLVVGGKPSEIEYFELEAQKRNIDDKVKFVGMKNDVAPYLWSSDVFIFPSIYEVFPLVVLQAAAAGLPIIATQGLHGATEVVKEGENGWLVQRNKEEVSQVMQSIMENQENLKAYSDAIARSALSYSVPSFVSHWKTVFS